MNLLIDKSFEKDLRKIKDKSIRLKVAQILEAILVAEGFNELNQVKKLKGENHYYRIKVGDYRLGFAFEDDTLTVVRFLHRKDIYKYFPK